MTMIVRWRLVVSGILFCTAIFLWQAPQVFGKGKDGGDVPSKANDAVADPYKGYPEEFTGRGILDALYSKTVVISDSEFILQESGVSFHEPGRNHASPEAFRRGQAVAFIANDQGRIVSLWKLNQLDDLMPK